MSTWDITLRSSIGPDKLKFFRLTLDGTRLTRTSWTEGRKPRETVTDLPNRNQAQDQYYKWRRKKMAEGFAYVADADRAARGEIVLDLKVPNRCSSEAFDLSPDGRTIAVGTMLRQAYGAELHLIDVATGHRELVHADAPAVLVEGEPPRQTFIHAVHFDATGRRLVYALNGETRLLDLDTLQVTVLASYREFHDAAHNSFRCKPMWDAQRRRLLVFDSGDVARVLDRDGKEVFSVSTKRSGLECWTGGLSRSGRLAAFCFSRGSWYVKESEEVNKIEVWDLDQPKLVHEFLLPRRPHELNLDPTDTLLVANPEPVQGPGAYHLETGEPAWHFPDSWRTDRWDTCYSWAFSPDGGTLAVGRRGQTDVVDTATRTPNPAFERQPGEIGAGRTNTVRISDDGSLLACGGDSGSVIVRRL